MIVIAGTFTLKPDAREQAVALAEMMMEETRQEEGCRTYRFHGDFNDPTRISIFEEWESQEALDAHGETPHIERFRRELPDLIAEPPEIYRYVVEERAPL